MADEPTAWEDINPTMALAPRREPPCGSLVPASDLVFRNELSACLSLVASVGMTEEAKADWLLVAWETLKHLPPDMLHRGCEVARQTCDHPAKIVPAIIAETADWMKLRQGNGRSSYAALPPPTQRHVMDRRGEAMSEEDTAELNGILENLGATARYRPDGSRYVASVDRSPKGEDRADGLDRNDESAVGAAETPSKHQVPTG